jgi:hypothetical protein
LTHFPEADNTVEYLTLVVLFMLVVMFRKECWETLHDMCLRLIDTGWKLSVACAALCGAFLVIGYETKPDVFVWIALLGIGFAAIYEFRERYVKRNGERKT